MLKIKERSDAPLTKTYGGTPHKEAIRRKTNYHSIQSIIQYNTQQSGQLVARYVHRIRMSTTPPPPPPPPRGKVHFGRRSLWQFQETVRTTSCMHCMRTTTGVQEYPGYSADITKHIYIHMTPPGVIRPVQLMSVHQHILHCSLMSYPGHYNRNVSSGHHISISINSSFI